jgi:O-antigen/teichoic acid export membrane protein
MGFYGIVSAFTIGNFLTFLSVLIFFRRDFKLLSLRVAVSRWVKLILRGSPFYFSALLTMLYARIGIVVLSKLVSDREIGFYLAALNLIENLYFVPTAFVTSVFPVFSRLHGTSVDALKKAYAKMMKYLVILTVAVAVGTLLISKEVIEFIYGGEFESAVPIMKILIFLWVLAFFNNIQSTLLFSVKKEMAQVKILMVVVVCNACLNVILISSYGYMGAAFASVATEGIMVVLLTAVLWKMEFRYVPDNCAFRLFVVAGGMAVLVYFMLKMNLIMAVIGGAVSYVGLLFALRVFDEEDMLFMRAIVLRRSGNE